jgi:23S rRNA pseudoU1915 N3-methylase RlmH
MTDEIKKVKVSENKVIPIKKEKDSEDPVLGADWFSAPYPNIFLLAKKFSGKTTVILNILSRCAGPNTKYIFIVSTINKDKIWEKILDTLNKKDYISYTSINHNNNNIIEDFVDESENKKIRWTHNYPKYIIVLDDQGKAMRSPALSKLTKNNRHHKSMVIMSTQSLTDLNPDTIAQIDYTLAYDRIADDKLKELYDKLNLSIEYDKFKECYDDATKKPYGFLYISRSGSNDELRDGFTEKYNVE